MIPSNCQDRGAVSAQVREWWAQYRTDAMTADEQSLVVDFFYLPASQQAWGRNGFGGSPDLLLAFIIDDAKAKGTLKPEYATAV